MVGRKEEQRGKVVLSRASEFPEKLRLVLKAQNGIKADGCAEALSLDK